MVATTHPRTSSWIEEIGNEGGWVVDNVSYSPKRVSWSNTKEGTSNPYRKVQIARGQNASTDYTHSEKLLVMPQARVDAYSWDTAGTPKRRRHDWVTGNLASLAIPATPTDLSLASADNLARTKAYQSIRRQQQAFQALVCAGELGETLRMIVRAATGLRRRLIRDVTTSTKKLSQMRRRRRETLGGFLKRRTHTAAELHLQAVFGWRPFFSDIGSANAWLERRLEIVDPSLPFKGSGGTETCTFAALTGGSGFATWRCTKATGSLASVRYYGRVSGRTLGNRVLMESRLLGVNLGEWLPSLYEIVPWSFFIDYFSNLGDVVESWSAWDTGVIWTSRSTLQERYVTAQEWAWKPTGTGSPTYATGSCTGQGPHLASNTTKTRKRDWTLEPPSLEFRIPGTGTKWANIASLGVVLAGGSRSLSKALGRAEPRWMTVSGAANW